jgi:hypothetical protein
VAGRSVHGDAGTFRLGAAEGLRCFSLGWRWGQLRPLPNAWGETIILCLG